MKVKYPYKEIQNSMYEANPRLTCKCFTIKEVNDNGKIKYETVYKSIKGKNQINIARKLLFDYLECKFLYRIYSIDLYSEKVQIDFAGVPSEKKTNSVTHLAISNFDKFKHISDIEIDSFIFDDSINNSKDVSKEFDSRIININNFNSSMLISLSYNYSDDGIYGWEPLDYIFLKCNIYGLKKHASLPLWIEYIISSFDLYKSENKSLAFFVLFAALDQYIEVVRWGVAQEFRRVLLSNDDYIRDLSMNQKCSEYLDNQRRLIDEKLLMILEDRFPDSNKKYIKIYQDIQKFETKRNQIAHCNEDYLYEEDDYENLLFDFIRLQYLITYGKDIDAIFKITHGVTH